MNEVWFKNTVATLGLIIIALITGYCYGRYKEGAEIENKVDYSTATDSASVVDDSQSEISH